MKQIPLLMLLLGGLAAWGTAQDPAEQPTFTLKLSTDSVLMGNYFTATFILEGGQGKDFAFPDFADFDLVGGPNYSSSMSVVNGAVSASISYTFHLQPRYEGEFYIEPAGVMVNGEALETQPALVMVYPNPDGLIQQPAPRELELRMPSLGSDDFLENFFQRPEWMMPFPLDSIPREREPVDTPNKRKTIRI